MSSATPAWFNAATVSPPPATETSNPLVVSAAASFATATVAVSNGASSKAPSGPFHTSVFMLASFAAMAFAEAGPASRIISSTATSFTEAARCGGFALNSFERRPSVGSTISQPAAFAFFSISRAVPARSCSQRLLPTFTPRAARKVFAMPPPITRQSTRDTRLPRRSSLVETFAPPTIAITGRFGCPNAAWSALSSASIVRPA